MKHAEESIDRVLSGLRDTEVPEGLELRVRRAMASPASVPARSGRPPVYALAAGLALLVGLAVFSIRRPMNPTVRAVAVRSAPIAVPVRHQNFVQAATPVRAIRHRTARLEAKPALTVCEDSLAWRELHAVSRPAPPLPLTKEERLLLQVAHTGDAQELAILNPELRAARNLHDKADFDQFFGESTSNDND